MMADEWTWRCDRVIPSDTSASRHVLDELVEQLEAQQWEQHEVFGVHLAVEEALVNAILHGNHMDANKRIHVTIHVSPTRVLIEITDEGNGFDPGALPDPTCPERLHSPCGRGVMLMRAFMSQVQFNKQGNCVVMEKRREATA